MTYLREGIENMEMKINRGKIIKKCIEEELSDLDFHYGNYESNRWIFERNMKKLTWYVYIYVYRFDPWQITFHLGTNVPGKIQVHAHQVEGVKGNGDIPGYWRYHDEESLIEVLKEMTEIIRERGIDVLKKLSIPEKINACDNEMHHELYLHHKELAEAFVERTGMVSTGYNEENLRRWFDYMDDRIEEMKKGTYDSAAKNELLEMAAFLGEQIVKYKGGNWKLWKNEKIEATNITYIKKIGKNEELEECINLIRVLVRRYLGNNRNWLEEPFFEVISEWNTY